DDWRSAYRPAHPVPRLACARSPARWREAVSGAVQTVVRPNDVEFRRTRCPVAGAHRSRGSPTRVRRYRGEAERTAGRGERRARTAREAPGRADEGLEGGAVLARSWQGADERAGQSDRDGVGAIFRATNGTHIRSNSWPRREAALLAPRDRGVSRAAGLSIS